jgi:hypothetical protein
MNSDSPSAHSGELTPFRQRLVASGLVSGSQLAKLLRDCGDSLTEGSPLDDAAFAVFLIAADILTTWQSDRLFQGKYKGFFLDHYVILKHVRVADTYSVFAARDTTTNQQVLLEIWPTISPGDGSVAASYRVVEQDGANE